MINANNSKGSKIDYSKLSKEELDELANKEDREALYETAVRFLNEKNLREGRKYLVFATQLGHPKASIALGELFEEEEDLERAMQYYKFAYSRGDISIACKLAKLLMDVREADALDILVSSAVLGNEGAVKMLHEYYAEIGNTKEADYWKIKIR